MWPVVRQLGLRHWVILEEYEAPFGFQGFPLLTLLLCLNSHTAVLSDKALKHAGKVLQ